MLTGPLLRVKFSKEWLIPRYVDVESRTQLELADRLLQALNRSAGMTRGVWEQTLRDEFGDEPGDFVLRGLIKLIDDRSEWSIVSARPPDEVRDAVFTAAARARVAGNFDRDQVLRSAAETLRQSVSEIEDSLFADLKSEQRLGQFDRITPVRLLQRYNLALAQAVVLKATGIRVDVRNDDSAHLRRLLRLVKFHRLVCEATAISPGICRLQLDGPLSLFAATQKYGMQLALFLPAVLASPNFELLAEVRWGAAKTPKRFRLTHEDGLVTDQPVTGVYLPPEVAMFASQFRKKVKDWDLLDETHVHMLESSFWVPDFSLVHKATGAKVALEILGDWRKRGAERHLERLRNHAGIPYLVAVSDGLKLDGETVGQIPGLLRFRRMPVPAEVAAAATQLVTA